MNYPQYPVLSGALNSMCLCGTISKEGIPLSNSQINMVLYSEFSLYLPGSRLAVVNVTVNTVIRILSASGSRAVPNADI